ncbi:MAG TPA: 16S rRNA (uracil(1498)-N(3))-methyltransferase [Pseudoxanthomonas sp.]|nr:16S rRNA (uracil(1498)-N(3))-methyltransferase [Pseudoxanthomonas sp.]
MRLTRCYVECGLSVGGRVTLPEAAGAHLIRVLRLRDGDPCALFNGDGHDYGARLVAAGKREVVAEIVSCLAIDNESPLRITLLQGIARGEKMDLILQKATELGVAAFVPVIAERTEVKLDAERTARRMLHWSSVIASACEQSGRARLPALAVAVPLATALATLWSDPVDAEASLKLTLDPNGEHSLSRLALGLDGHVGIAVGPEGGWSPRDRERLRGAGFAGLQLGPRVLRTETAGLAAIAALQACFGDLQ